MHNEFSMNRMGMMDDWKWWINNGLLLHNTAQYNNTWTLEGWWSEGKRWELNAMAQIPIAGDHADRFCSTFSKPIRKQFYLECGFPDSWEIFRQFGKSLQFKHLLPLRDWCFTSCMQKSREKLRLCINLKRSLFQKSSASSILLNEEGDPCNSFFMHTPLWISETTKPFYECKKGKKGRRGIYVCWQIVRVYSTSGGGGKGCEYEWLLYTLPIHKRCDLELRGGWKSDVSSWHLGSK